MIALIFAAQGRHLMNYYEMWYVRRDLGFLCPKQISLGEVDVTSVSSHA